MKGRHREGSTKKLKGHIDETQLGETQLWVCKHPSIFGDVEAQPLEEKVGHSVKGKD